MTPKNEQAAEAGGFKIGDVVQVVNVPAWVRAGWDHDIAIIDGFRRVDGNSEWHADVVMLWPFGFNPTWRGVKQPHSVPSHGPCGAVKLADIRPDGRAAAVKAKAVYDAEQQRQQAAYQARQRAYAERVELVAKKYGVTRETVEGIKADMAASQRGSDGE